jgi:hypothetical protein
MADEKSGKQAIQGKLNRLLVNFSSLYGNPIVWDWGAGTDVHALCMLQNKSGSGIYVRGHTGLSTENEAAVSARLVNYEKAIALWEQGKPIENGGDATVMYLIFPDSPVMIEYNSGKLHEIIGRRSRNLHSVA